MNKTLLAVLAGIGIGMLIAPDKGSSTRKKLRGKFDDFKDDAEDKVSDLVDKGREVVKAGKSKIADALN
jgi:gas vesicle protein